MLDQQPKSGGAAGVPMAQPPAAQAQIDSLKAQVADLQRQIGQQPQMQQPQSGLPPFEAELRKMLSHAIKPQQDVGQ